LDIEISYRDIERTEAIETHIRDRLAKDLGRFGDRLTRVEVHVGDLNGPKSGADDKRCMVEVRPSGSGPLAVESTGDDLYAVVSDAVGKSARAVERRLDRGRESPRIRPAG
jgi:ribosomal subunit interface protein